MADPMAAFAKDLGYLAKFFDKLEAHAPNLPAANQARYRTLIAEERTRWKEITALMSGAAPANTAPAKAAPEKGREKAPTPVVAAAPGTGSGSLTVGSLRDESSATRKPQAARSSKP